MLVCEKKDGLGEKINIGVSMILSHQGFDIVSISNVKVYSVFNRMINSNTKNKNKNSSARPD